MIRTNTVVTTMSTLKTPINANAKFFHSSSFSCESTYGALWVGSFVTLWARLSSFSNHVLSLSFVIYVSFKSGSSLRVSRNEKFIIPQRVSFVLLHVLLSAWSGLQTVHTWHRRCWRLKNSSSLQSFTLAAASARKHVIKNSINIFGLSFINP